MDKSKQIDFEEFCEFIGKDTGQVHCTILRAFIFFLLISIVFRTNLNAPLQLSLEYSRVPYLSGLAFA